MQSALLFHSENHSEGKRRWRLAGPGNEDFDSGTSRVCNGRERLLSHG